MGTEFRLALPTIEVLEEVIEEIIDTSDSGEFIVEVDNATVGDLALSLGVLLQRGLPFDGDLVEAIIRENPKHNQIPGYRKFLKDVKSAIDIDTPEIDLVLETIIVKSKTLSLGMI